MTVSGFKYNNKHLKENKVEQSCFGSLCIQLENRDGPIKRKMWEETKRAI